MVGLVALDFILWAIRACVMRISLVIGIFRMNPDDLTADAAGLRVPGHVIANFEFCGHDRVSSVIAAFPTRQRASGILDSRGSSLSLPERSRSGRSPQLAARLQPSQQQMIIEHASLCPERLQRGRDFEWRGL